MGTSRHRTGSRAVCTQGWAVYIWLAANLLRSLCLHTHPDLTTIGQWCLHNRLPCWHSQHSQILFTDHVHRDRSDVARWTSPISPSAGTGTACVPLAPSSCRPRQATPLHQTFTGCRCCNPLCRTHMSNPNLHPDETCFVTSACDCCYESATMPVTI